MKVIFTGKSKEDHFYPTMAVIEELNTLIDNENLADTHIYYFSDKELSKKILYENSVVFKKIFFSKKKGSLVSFFGILSTFLQVFSIFPDVIFSTGGDIAYPVLYAAKVLKIPVIIHEVYSIPNEVNRWSEKIAKAITLSYKQSVDFFSEHKKIIHTGQPIIHDLQKASSHGAYEFLELEKDTPILWIMAGENHTEVIDMVMEEALSELLHNYQIVYQTSKSGLEELKLLTDATLNEHPFKYRFHLFQSLNSLSMKMLAGVSDIVISRADLFLFEIAHWGIPAIIIPLTGEQYAYQIKNAYNYAREGACVVIEENNLTDQGLIFEINRINNNPEIKNEMKKQALEFALPDAGKKIAQEIVAIVLSHED